LSGGLDSSSIVAPHRAPSAGPPCCRSPTARSASSIRKARAGRSRRTSLLSSPPPAVHGIADDAHVRRRLEAGSACRSRRSQDEGLSPLRQACIRKWRVMRLARGRPDVRRAARTARAATTSAGRLPLPSRPLPSRRRRGTRGMGRAARREVGAPPRERPASDGPLLAGPPRLPRVARARTGYAAGAGWRAYASHRRLGPRPALLRPSAPDGTRPTSHRPPAAGPPCWPSVARASSARGLARPPPLRRPATRWRFSWRRERPSWISASWKARARLGPPRSSCTGAGRKAVLRDSMAGILPEKRAPPPRQDRLFATPRASAGWLREESRPKVRDLGSAPNAAPPARIHPARRARPLGAPIPTRPLARATRPSGASLSVELWLRGSGSEARMRARPVVRTRVLDYIGALALRRERVDNRDGSHRRARIVVIGGAGLVGLTRVWTSSWASPVREGGSSSTTLVRRGRRANLVGSLEERGRCAWVEGSMTDPEGPPPGSGGGGRGVPAGPSLWLGEWPQRAAPGLGRSTPSAPGNVVEGLPRPSAREEDRVLVLRIRLRERLVHPDDRGAPVSTTERPTARRRSPAEQMLRAIHDQHGLPYVGYRYMKRLRPAAWTTKGHLRERDHEGCWDNIFAGPARR